MSIGLMSLVFSCNMPELKTDGGKTVPDSTAKYVLLAMADNANDEGEGSYAGVDTLCKKTNFSTSTVCNALNALRENGFTALVGKSKRDTNNYTILVTRILEFQWPKRSDSSHRNDSVSATETNPSLTISKPSEADTAKTIKAANRTVNGILAADKHSSGKSWTLLPEIFQPLAKAFCEATTLTYSKKFANDWLATISDWIAAGYTPEMITAAVRDICENDSYLPVARPGSLDWKLRDMQVKRANVRPVYPPPSLPTSQPSGPAITREEYERIKAAGVTP